MQELIRSALQGHDASYLEVRVEEIETTRLLFRGRELEEVSRSATTGGCVRALAGGGWGFATFTDLSDLRGQVAQAVHHAHLVGGEPVHLALADPAVAVIPPHAVKDPAAIPLATKVRLLQEYDEILWSVPQIASTSITYGDSRRHIIYANAAGSYIDQTRLDVTLGLRAMARRDGDVQQAGISVGSLGDFGIVEGRHQEVREIAQRAVAMLDAPAVQGGEYSVVLDPVLAGVFIHEAFGHLSEADHIYENPPLQELMVLGRRFAGPHLNVVDGAAALPGLRGSYRYDEEGTPATRTDLIREGVLVGRLHSRETAAAMGEPPSGNARAITFRFPPIVRMTNTFIEPGEAMAEDLFSEVRDGIYCKNWYGGTTSMEMFTFSAGEAYRIHNGRVAEMIRPVVLTGNLFTTLENLDAVANDLGMNQGGGCGKGGQSPLPVSTGAPHIRIRRCLVGGR